jgi:phage terminase large subunit
MGMSGVVEVAAEHEHSVDSSISISPGNIRLTQIRVARVFERLLQPRRYKGAKGGRGSGKSHFFAEYLISKACAKPGLRAVCIREVQKSLALSSKQLIEDKIQRYQLEDMFHPTKTEITTPGGGMIIFQGMQNHTADTIRSLEGFDLAWVEEAHSLSDYSLSLLRPTMRKPGSEMMFSWNPESPDDPVDKFFEERPPNSILIKANYDRNPWFPDELQKEMEYDRRRDPDRYAHVWLGAYRQMSQARVFHNWTVEEFESPDLERDDGSDTRFYYGADWGYAKDPTVLVRCFIVGRKLYIDQEAYAIGCEIDKIPELFEKVPGSKRWPITADSSRPETISYVKNYGGFFIEPSLKGKSSVEDGIEFLKSYDIVVHPRCRHTRDELSLYSWKVDKRTNQVLPILADKDNHVIDAMRYAIESERRAGVSMVDYL